MLKKLKMWWVEKQYRWAVKVIKAHGFSVVRLVNRAGTDYIVGNNGVMFKVGRAK